jgi:hypothetical protein
VQRKALLFKVEAAGQAAGVTPLAAMVVQHPLAQAAAGLVVVNLQHQYTLLAARVAHLATSPAALAARLMAHQQRFRAAQA